METKTVKKSQILNSKSQINSHRKCGIPLRRDNFQIQNSKRLLFGICDLGLIWYLVVVFWNFMKTAHIFISGFVQGVGFRQFIKNNADKLELTGFVGNLPDGRVEAVFSGSKEKIEEMIKVCKKGPFLSEVENVEVIREKNPPPAAELAEGFEIRIALQDDTLQS